MVKSVDPLLITAIIAALLQYVQIENASVVELVDTRDSKSRALKSVPVRVRPLVPFSFPLQIEGIIFSGKPQI